jgi:hypothetical protein
MKGLKTDKFMFVIMYFSFLWDILSRRDGRHCVSQTVNKYEHFYARRKSIASLPRIENYFPQTIF